MKYPESYLSRTCIDDSILMKKKDEKITWIIDGLLPRGLTLLAGKPKSGKSYLCLDLALHIVECKDFLGYPTTHGEVLYLSLEDDFIIVSDRRSKLSDLSFIENIYYREDFPKGNDAIQELKKLISGSPNLRLIIIDIVGCVLPYDSGDQSNRYDFISNSLGQIRQILKNTGVSILLVHHTSKKDYALSQDKILGSTAFQGKVDTFWILEEKGNMNILTVNGKYFGGAKEVHLIRNPNGSFTKVGSPQKSVSEMEKLLKFVNELDKPISPKEVAVLLKKEVQTVTQMLYRLTNQGLLTKLGKGQYVSLDFQQRTKYYSPFNH